MAVDPHLADQMRQYGRTRLSVPGQYMRALTEIRAVMNRRGVAGDDRLTDIAAVLRTLDRVQDELDREETD